MANNAAEDIGSTIPTAYRLASPTVTRSVRVSSAMDSAGDTDLFIARLTRGVRYVVRVPAGGVSDPGVLLGNTAFRVLGENDDGGPRARPAPGTLTLNAQGYGEKSGYINARRAAQQDVDMFAVQLKAGQTYETGGESSEVGLGKLRLSPLNRSGAELASQSGDAEDDIQFTPSRTGT